MANYSSVMMHFVNEICEIGLATFIFDIYLKFTQTKDLARLFGMPQGIP